MKTARWVAQNEDGTYAVGEGDVEIATCKNREDAMRLKEPEQEPVAIVEASWNDDEGFMLVKRLDEKLPKGSHLYTFPPKREWFGLTEEEQIKLVQKHIDSPVALLFEVEAKLKEKNT